MKLQWIDDRWHCEGKGIHAGDGMKLRGTNGQWISVRIESSDQGRRLFAYADICGLEFVRTIDTENDRLRW